MLFLDRIPSHPVKSAIEISPMASNDTTTTTPPNGPPLVLSVLSIDCHEFPPVAVLAIENPGRTFRVTLPNRGATCTRVKSDLVMTVYCPANRWMTFTHIASGAKFEVQVKWIETGDYPGVRLGFLDDTKRFAILRREVVERRRAASSTTVEAQPVVSQAFLDGADIEAAHGGVVSTGKLQPIEGGGAMRQLYPTPGRMAGMTPTFGTT